MTIKYFRNLTAFVLLSLLLASCSPTGAEQPTPTPAARIPVTIALGYIPDVQFSPFYLALNKGYYAEEGLEVTFEHGIVPDLIRLLGAGEKGINFAAASGDEVIPASLQGIPIKYVMTWYRQYPVAAASIEGKGPALSSPADLKGQTVGIPGPYGASYTGLQALLKAGGLTLDDIQLKEIGFTQVENLATGQVPIAMVYAANEPVQLSTRGMNVNTLMVADYAKLAANGLITNQQTFNENPELAGKVVRATLRGIEETIDNPEAGFEAAQTFVPEAGGENKDRQLQVLKESVKLMQPKPGDPAESQPLGWTDPDVWAATQDFLFEVEVITKKGDVGQMFSNSFISAATSEK